MEKDFIHFAVHDGICDRGMAIDGRVDSDSFLLTFFWCLLSCIWAIDPAISVRRSASMIMISLAISTCIRNLAREITLRVIYVFLTTIVIASYISVALSKLNLSICDPSFERVRSDAHRSLAWRIPSQERRGRGDDVCRSGVSAFGINRKKPIHWVLFVSALLFLVGTEIEDVYRSCGPHALLRRSLPLSLFTKRRGTFLVAARVSYVILFACFSVRRKLRRH